MADRSFYIVPECHGQVGLMPPLAEWPAVAERNRVLAASWDFEVAGVGIQQLRRTARTEILDAGAEYSARLGIAAERRDSDALIALTGHQPALIHPGVWIKHLALQRIAEQIGGTGIDIVVDSDAFAEVAASTPLVGTHATRAVRILATGGRNACYACAAPPTAFEVDEFSTGISADLAGHDDATRSNATRYCEGLKQASGAATNLADAVTAARRLYEAPQLTTYLEFAVSMFSASVAFNRFAVDVILNAERFARVVNKALAEHRIANGIRSAAQPFADLVVASDRVELPLWVLSAEGRETAYVRCGGDSIGLLAGNAEILTLPCDAEAAVTTLMGSGLRLAPKAVTLTLFTRLFVADLFIHGIGGARYDEVTDAVCRAYFGVEPLPYVVASLTMHLAVASGVTRAADEIAAVKERLHRLEHNPNEVIDLAELTEDQRSKATEFAEEKCRLVLSISEADADKKALGVAIREVNAQLAALLEPLRRQWESELVGLEARQTQAAVLAARDYPFFLWTPQDVADTLDG